MPSVLATISSSDLFGQRLAAGEPVDDGGTMAAAERASDSWVTWAWPVQGGTNSGRKVITTRTGRLLHPLDQQTEQLPAWSDRSSARPRRAASTGLPRREPLELFDQDLERPLLLALRAEVELRITLACRDAEHAGDQRHGLGQLRRYLRASRASSLSSLASGGSSRAKPAARSSSPMIG